MAYTSTPEDLRIAWLLGICYVVLAIFLSYMLFKIWPPVPWPSDKDLDNNPVLMKELERSLAECSPTPTPKPTPIPTPASTATVSPTTVAGTTTATVTPSVTPTVTPPGAPTSTPATTESPAVIETGAPQATRVASSPILVGNVPIRFFGYWCVSTTFDERLIMLVIIAGMLGAFVHGATSLADYIGNNNFNRSWTWFYLLRPPIGMALALVFYFVIRGGFLTSSGGGKDINPYGIAALAGLVGMFSKQATDKLGEVFSTLFRAAKGEGDDKRAGSLNPEPLAVTGVEPASVAAASTNQSITVNGTGFAEGSAIYVDNTAQLTTFVSATQLTGQLDDALVATPGDFKLKVVNPDGTESTAIDFKVS